jgi:hypothetical protein
MTFCNDLERDHATLERFRAFRLDCEKKRFRYFLELFNPNLGNAVAPREVGSFLNDHIIRGLAGITESGRPLFLQKNTAPASPCSAEKSTWPKVRSPWWNCCAKWLTVTSPRKRP